MTWKTPPVSTPSSNRRFARRRTNTCGCTAASRPGQTRTTPASTAANARKKASPLEDDAQAPVIWLITDNKPGHRNQLWGLGGRLRALTGAKLDWLNAADYPVPLWRALLGLAPTVDKALPQPDLIVAAGSGTHRLILALRRYRKARTLVLMKPAFPLNWVDGAIIPAHDDVKPSKTVLNTEGVINAITPLAELTGKPNALILVGGPSEHFDWNNDTDRKSGE